MEYSFSGADRAIAKRAHQTRFVISTFKRIIVEHLRTPYDDDNDDGGDSSMWYGGGTMMTQQPTYVHINSSSHFTIVKHHRTHKTCIKKRYFLYIILHLNDLAAAADAAAACVGYCWAPSRSNARQ